MTPRVHDTSVRRLLLGRRLPGARGPQDAARPGANEDRGILARWREDSRASTSSRASWRRPGARERDGRARSRRRGDRARRTSALRERARDDRQEHARCAGRARRRRARAGRSRARPPGSRGGRSGRCARGIPLRGSALGAPCHVPRCVASPQAFARAGANAEAEPSCRAPGSRRARRTPRRVPSAGAERPARRDSRLRRGSSAREAAARWHAYYRARRIQVRANPTTAASVSRSLAEALEPARAKKRSLAPARERLRARWSLLGETERLLDHPAARHAWDRALSSIRRLPARASTAGPRAHAGARSGRARVDSRDRGARRLDELRYRQAHRSRAPRGAVAGASERADWSRARSRVWRDRHTVGAGGPSVVHPPPPGSSSGSPGGLVGGRRGPPASGRRTRRGWATR